MKNKTWITWLVLTVVVGLPGFLNAQVSPQSGHALVGHSSPQHPGPGGHQTVGHSGIGVHRSHGVTQPSDGHQHHKEVCLPGVYRTEIENFRGNGFVARKHPYRRKDDTLARAGNPHLLAKHTERSYEGHYIGYYVGGGSSIFDHGPSYPNRRQEGTWGYDYEPVGLWKRVRLHYSRGRLYQDGVGQYEQDPPFEITNVFAIRYGERIKRALGHEVGESGGEE